MFRIHKYLYFNTLRFLSFTLLLDTKNKSKNYSIKLNQLFIEILKQVAESPTIGRKTEFENVRVRIVRDYLLFYKYDQKQIKVLTVWDGNREEKTLKIE